MELLAYLRLVRKRWWLVALGLALGLATATSITMVTPREYASEVTFFVNTPNRGVGEAYQGSMFSQQRVKSYADMLTGDRLARMITNRYQLGLDEAGVQRRLMARSEPDTVLLHVTATDRDLGRSLRLANAVATEFVALIRDVERTSSADAVAVNVAVVDGPTAHATPVTPRPLRNAALGLLLGLLVGCVAAVLRETLDTTIKSSEVLAEVAEIPVLGVVPFDTAARREPLIVAANMTSARAEAYRQVRTNLHFVHVDQPVRSIVVTSSHRDEGKSTTSCNLAISLASAGERVLLLEADLRRPRLGHYLGLESAVGLTDVLAGRARVEDVIQPWGRAELSVLLCGSIPPNPSELLGSRNMTQLLRLLSASYDRIIIDTPPLLPVTDAAVVAAHADGVVLVARSGSTTITQLSKSAQALRSVGAHLLGGVLTMQRIRHTDGDSYPYYYSSATRRLSPRGPVAAPPTQAAAVTPESSAAGRV
jgi:capsular exopolysaccharide synthesis family protein